MEQPIQLPNRIKALDPQLVNRIAAGEIIQRPFNALKELIENCLDAGSTNINIQLKEGGLKLIQITDNGCGIDKEDLKIVCERFTTSKLKEFEDLRSINTFGFRGEALASISHVSRLTISSRTAVDPCGFKATYSEGKLTKDGIKPCAMPDKGTQINVEDLFYNSSIRRNALRNGSEEFSKIYEVVSRYAIHNYHISFFLKRTGEKSMDLKTNGSLAATGKGKCLENETFLQEIIGTVYGNDLKKELERLAIDYDPKLKFEMNGYMSNSKYTQLKQMIFILFINERLVDCQPIKKTLQSVFSLYMPKNTNCFIYLNLQMSPNNLDVNIHPTKHEVRFLFQDEIINRIQTCFEQKLLNSDISRTYYVKSLTLDPYTESNTKKNNKDLGESDVLDESKKTASSSPIIYPYQLTRVDSKERKLDSYLHQTTLNESIRGFKENSMIINEEKKKINSQSENTNEDEDNEIKSSLRYQKLSRQFQFKSLIDLKNKVEKNASKNIRDMLKDMSFVGCLDKELALIQYKTGLFIANTRALSEELFYQIGLFNFGNFGYFKLEEPISIFELSLMALDDPVNEWEESYGPKEKLAKRCAKLLYSKSQMLDDYFSIKIDKMGSEEQIFLIGLPMLIEDYEPDLVDLPSFIIRLATEVDYDNERDCFDIICKELGYFYSTKNPKYITQEQKENSSQESGISNPVKPEENWLIEHVIYNAFRTMLLASTENQETIFFKLVDLSKLYRVFERC